MENLTAVLDTSFIVDLLRGRKKAALLLAELEGRGAILAATPITVLELYRGAYLSMDPERSLEAAKKLLAALIVLPPWTTMQQPSSAPFRPGFGPRGRRSATSIE